MLGGILDTINNLCGAGDEMDKVMCLEGALPFVNVYDKNLARAACEVYIADDEKAVCLKAQKMTNFDMQRDFERYTIDSRL